MFQTTSCFSILEPGIDLVDSWDVWHYLSYCPSEKVPVFLLNDTNFFDSSTFFPSTSHMLVFWQNYKLFQYFCSAFSSQFLLLVTRLINLRHLNWGSWKVWRHGQNVAKFLTRMEQDIPLVQFPLKSQSLLPTFLSAFQSSGFHQKYPSISACNNLSVCPALIFKLFQTLPTNQFWRFPNHRIRYNRCNGPTTGIKFLC